MNRARALAALLLIGCGAGGSAPPSLGDGAPSADAGGDLASADIKPRIRGVLTRSGPPPAKSTYPFIDAMVVLVNWSDLETTAGQYSGSGWSAIDTAVAAGYHVRLRISAGVHSPQYVLQLGGPPRSLAASGGAPNVDCSGGGVGVYEAAGGTGCVPYFWTAPVQDRYRALMTEVASRYEANPGLSEVVDGLCMTLFDEVFYREHCQAASFANMAAAGFTFELDQQCQMAAVQIHAALFPRTRMSLAVNAWDQIEPGSCMTNFPPAQQLADWAHGILGERLTVQHNHLRYDDGCPAAQDSCYIQQFSGAKGFQTRVYAGLGGTPQGLAQTLANAVTLGANFVELPLGWMLDTPTLQSYDQQLRQTP